MRSVSSIAEGRAATVRDEHRAAAAVKWKREEKALAHSWQQGKVSSEPPPEHHCSPAWLVAATTLSVCIRNSSSHSEGLTAAVVVAGRREAGQVILRDSHNHSACSGGFERACLPREPPGRGEGQAPGRGRAPGRRQRRLLKALKTCRTRPMMSMCFLSFKRPPRVQWYIC